MCNHLHTHARTDPTRTLGIRRNFESDLFKRFRKLKGLIREALVKDKALTTNIVSEGAFDFPTSSAKVDAFMMWLREMEQRGDISLRDVPGRGAIDNRWANTYIDTAYKQGQRRARAEMRKQGIDVPEEGAFDQPVHADRVGMIYSRVYSELDGITAAMDQQISRVLAEGITNGDNPLEIARAINNRVDKVGIHRARLLARTEVIRAHHSANVQEYRNAGLVGVNVQAEWVTAANPCPQCVAAQENGPYTLDEIERLIPLHPQCYVAGTEVRASEVKAATKRWFNGDGVTVRTASGKQFTCTPNHPILTHHGWVAAGSLKKSDYAVCGFLGDGDAAISRDDYDVVSSIENLPGSAFIAGSVTAKKVKTSAPDFHGDGIDEDVAIVYSDLFLGDGIETKAVEHLENMFFVPAIVRGSSRLGGSYGHPVFATQWHSFGGRVGSGHLMPSFAGRHFAPFQRLCLALSSAADAILPKNAMNHVSGYAKLIGRCVFGKARSVHGDDFVIRKVKGGRFSGLNALLLQYSFDNIVADAKIAAQVSDCAPTGVFLDKIVGVDIVPLSCHVYNLQTGSNSYLAEGIISHNCRCVAVPIVKDD